MTVIATAVRVCIESCHECTFYLGVNRPPLLVGLNRFIQVSPRLKPPTSHIVDMQQGLVPKGAPLH